MIPEFQTTEQLAVYILGQQAEIDRLRAKVKSLQDVTQITELKRQLSYSQQLNRDLENKVIALLKKRRGR